MKTSLFQFMLPTHTNDRRSYEHARKTFKAEVLRVAGGYTEMPIAYGAWKGPDSRVYSEGMEPLLIGCDQDQYWSLVGTWFTLFADQFSLAVMRVGELEVVDRPKLEVAAA